jgi:hypothetical protein
VSAREEILMALVEAGKEPDDAMRLMNEYRTAVQEEREAVRAMTQPDEVVLSRDVYNKIIDIVKKARDDASGIRTGLDVASSTPFTPKMPGERVERFH